MSPMLDLRAGLGAIACFLCLTCALAREDNGSQAEFMGEPSARASERVSAALQARHFQLAIGTTKMIEATQPGDDFEREKWRAELELKRRELELKEREQHRLETEQELRRAEQAKSVWTSPLTVAVLAAAIAAAGNAVVAFVNGRQQRALELEKNRAEISLERTKAESNRILEMIKTGDQETAAANLSFLLKSGLVSDSFLETKLNAFLAARAPGSGPALPSPSGRIGFEKSGDLTQSMQERLQALFNKYFDYLDRIAFSPAKERVSVKVVKGSSAESAPNAYYVDNTIFIDPRLADDASVPLREYNHHLLNTSAGSKAWSGHYAALESGLADYFACSFLNNPRLGEKASKFFKELGRPYIRNLDNDRQFTELAKTTSLEYPYLGAEIWGGAFWEMRERLSRDVADGLLASVWLNFFFPDRDEDIPAAFVKAALAQAKKSDKRFYDIMLASFRQRKFPVQ